MLTGEVPFKGESGVSVAMKHVREGLPDVQRRRPEVSAALAAVVERATAKELAQPLRVDGGLRRRPRGGARPTRPRARARATGEATAVLQRAARRASPGGAQPAPPRSRWPLYVADRGRRRASRRRSLIGEQRQRARRRRRRRPVARSRSSESDVARLRPAARRRLREPRAGRPRARRRPDDGVGDRELRHARPRQHQGRRRPLPRRRPPGRGARAADHRRRSRAGRSSSTSPTSVPPDLAGGPWSAAARWTPTRKTFNLDTARPALRATTWSGSRSLTEGADRCSNAAISELELLG